MYYTWARVNAFSSTFSPKYCSDAAAHFSMGHLVAGFLEETISGYHSAQMIGWDHADLPWWKEFRPSFLPSAGDIEFTPRLIAKLPLIGASGFPLPTNTLISNVIRLEVK